MTLSPAWLDELRARTVLSAVIAPIGQADPRRARVEGVLPVPQRKDAELHRQRRQGLLPLLRLRRARRRDPLPHRQSRHAVHGRGQGACRQGRAWTSPPPIPQAQERAERTASLTDVMGEVAEMVCRAAAGPRRRRGPRISQAPRHRRRDGRSASGSASRPTAAPRSSARSHKLGEDKLIETGMLIQPEEGGKETYDRFRGRLMIPIRDPRGRVIAFGGRILGDGEPKYLNSPRHAALRQGPHPLQPRPRRARQPHRQAADRRRRLYGRDRARPRRHRRGRRAQRHRASPKPSSSGMWRLDPSPILCFDGDSAGPQGRDPRRARAPCPCIGPDRTLRFVELPAGQDPDDVVRSGGREAFEALLAKPEPLDARLWRHELEAEPLTTPEAWAGLKQRLIDHAATIGHADLARIYREDWLDRFYEQRRPRRTRRASSAAPRSRSRTAASCRPTPPVGDERPRHRRQRHRRADRPRPDPRLRQFPRGVARPLRAARRAPDRRPGHRASCATSWSTPPSPAPRLIGRRLPPYWATDGAAGGKAPRAMGFSFTRRDSDPDRARSDLAAAVEIIAASGGSGKGPGAMQRNG